MIHCIKIWKKQRNYIGQNHRECGMMLRRATEKICRIYNGYYEIHFPESATLEDYLCYTGDDDHNAMVSRF